jgi:hypothetical protein
MKYSSTVIKKKLFLNKEKVIRTIGNSLEMVPQSEPFLKDYLYGFLKELFLKYNL